MYAPPVSRMHGLNLTCGIASTKREILHGKPVVEYLVEDHDLIRVQRDHQLLSVGHQPFVMKIIA